MELMAIENKYCLGSILMFWENFFKIFLNWLKHLLSKFEDDIWKPSIGEILEFGFGAWKCQNLDLNTLPLTDPQQKVQLMYL